MRFIRSFKLEDLCLDIIVRHLDLFVYSKTVPKKHIDFLLRLYSEDVFHQYSSWNSINEVCMLWFLNPYSKKIKLSNITPAIIYKLQAVGPFITSLNLQMSLVTENILNAIICCVPHVTYLNLSHTYCSDKTILRIQRMCRDLTTLNVRGCAEVTDRGMEILCNSKSLEILDITGTTVCYDGIENILKGVPSLQCLKFENFGYVFYEIHKQKFENGTYENVQYNLVELVYEDVDYCPYSLSVIHAWTVLCPNVKKVHLLFSVSRRVLHLCARFQHLEELKVQMPVSDDFSVKDDLSSTLPITENLTSLYLICTEIPSLKFINSLKHLKCLYLLDVYFTSFVEEEIKISETKLNTLAITGSNFEYCHSRTYKATALLISLSKNVTKLRLAHLKTLPQEILNIVLNGMKKLTFVDFSYSNITANSVIPFFQIPSMKIIHLDLCRNFSLEECPLFKNSLAKNSTCTLSWRIMYDDSDDSDCDT